jgi:NAD(P)-dependent dehydrogenase (short-subunit alcohol dehydrogenase family)
MNQRLSNLNNHFSSSRGPQWTLKTFMPFEFTQSALGSLKGQTIFITGASRGIGLEIAKRCARDGANIVIVAKTVTPHPKLEGTIYTAAKEIEALGGKCLPIQCDIRDEKAVEAAIEKTVQTFGGLDVLINNASAIQPNSVEYMDVKRFDLIMSINTRGTFVCSKFAIPHLRKSKNPHILTISPPLYMGNDVSRYSLVTAANPANMYHSRSTGLQRQAPVMHSASLA